MDEIVALLESHNIGIEFMDERFLGHSRANFRGKLTRNNRRRLNHS